MLMLAVRLLLCCCLNLVAAVDIVGSPVAGIVVDVAVALDIVVATAVNDDMWQMPDYKSHLNCVRWSTLFIDLFHF